MRKRILAMLSALTVFVTILAPTAVSYAAPEEDMAELAETTTLTVGTDKQYQTISEAVAAAKAIDPQSEADRVTINVDPGNYEEQVKIQDLSFVTLQQTPGTDGDGRVNLYWYYCTGYCAGNTGLDGNYDPKVNWSNPGTWYGYGDVNEEGEVISNNEEDFTVYRLGQVISDVDTISYYDADGVAHRDVPVQKDHLGDFNDQAALVVDSASTDITIKDFNIVNTIPVMVTEGEKEFGVAPQEDRNADNATDYVLPRRDNLAICDENTVPNGTDRVVAALAIENDVEKVRALEALTDLTPEESAYLVRSNKYNERGHAIAIDGDKIILEGIRARGNQDSVWVGRGRQYFKECDLIGGTDYIYGDATVVFDSCLLGAEGMTNQSYGATITAANHDAANPYGYLFFNCTVYNLLDNIGTSMYGRPWRQSAQITFYNTKIDDTAEIGASPAGIDSLGWRDMSGSMADMARFYEYGTYNASGADVDLSGRLVNKSVEEGGQGMGTVLDQWEILEFNPRNYFNSDFWLDQGKSEWDPMNFGDTYLSEVDAQIEASAIDVPEGEETTINLPTPSDDNIEFHWASASSNAVVSEDGQTIEVVRPALGEEPIETSVILYARDKTTGYGDKVEIPVTIAATNDDENVFDMPVTINQSTDAENTYTIRITKNGALIKEQQIEVNSMTTQATVENIPASADGIDYDVQIISVSDEFTITVPEDGRTTVRGVVGNQVQLEVTSNKLASRTVDIEQAPTSLGTGASVADNGDGSFTVSGNGTGGAYWRLSDLTPNISTTNAVTLEFTLDMSAGYRADDNGASVEVTNGQPSGFSTDVSDTRYARVNAGRWDQLNMFDPDAPRRSGSSSDENQWLNCANAKFGDSPVQNVRIIVDFKNSKIIGEAKSATSSQWITYNEFDAFPENADKNNIYLSVFPGSAGDNTFTIEDISVSYDEIVTGEEPDPTPVPDGTGVYEFKGDNTDVIGGNQCDNTYTLVFVDGVDQNVAKYFADEEDGSIIDPELVTNYKNFIASTGDGAHPQIQLNAPAGKYRLYYLGFQSGNNVTAEVGGKIYTAAPGVNFAYKQEQSSDILKLYAIDIEMAEPNQTVTFNSTDPWLPDLYAVVAVGTSELDPSIRPTPVPTAEPQPTAEPTAAPTAEPSAEGRIVSAYTEDGNTYVELENIESGVVVGADYGDNDILVGMETADVSGDEIVLQGIEADKVFVWDSLSNMEPLCAAADVSKESPVQPGEEVYVDFTTMSNVPVYSAESGQGFVAQSGAIRAEGFERQVAPTDEITISSNGAAVTESDGDYLHEKENDLDGDDYNYGGLIYRVDTGAPGAYRLEVEVTGSSSDTRVAPTGMDAGRLTGTSTWDNAGNVPRTVSAKWNGSVWTYDFATGEDFVEIEIEPTSLASASDPKTVGVKSIRVIPLENNPAGDKPTIHILGDSTQKTYTFNETISAWGQTLVNYFDPDKVNVVNYSMGGRAMKSNYNEGRFDQILISGKEGDFVFIHSAHNDETVSTNRFSRGSGVETNNLKVNNASYNRWLDMYVEAIKARGMTPVLVTAMPRTGSGRYSESSNKPNGFNPDSPANMRAKAASDPEVGLVELYEGAKDYIDSLDAREVMYIYNNVEAGETPAENAANGAKGDGTHYREAASKQWNRIMLQSIYDQSVASNDVYTDKDIMQELVSYMKEEVADAAESGDWSAVFPEMASDVSAVGIVPGATKQAESNYYYRNNIEKALQLGLLHKNDDNLFKPNETITVGEFARGIETAFGLEENSLTNYTKTYAELQAEGAAALQSEDTAETAAVSEDAVDSDQAELSDGNITITVQQPEGGTVTVYNESQRRAETADVPSGVTTSQVISDNNYFTLTAPSENVVTGTDSAGVFPENTEISTNYVEFRNSNPEKIFTLTAKESGTITVYCRFNDNKQIELYNTATDSTQSKYIGDGEAGDGSESALHGTVHFDVEAGTTYQLWARGGTGRLFGVMFEAEYPQSTESLAVNAGDQIRVSTAVNSGYVFDAILVDGEQVSTSREYTFEVTGDTTVSAAFSKEPEVISETYIATDAALTREAMGAILYDAYLAAYGKDEDGNWNKVSYMNQNGAVPSPDDPNYDPNIQYEGSPYTPLVGWGALTDTDQLNMSLYAKVKEAYNLGLMRSEQGIARGSIALGNQLEPKAEVTRAKAAKTLVFAFILTQEPRGESQTLPDGINHASETAEIAVPNEDAPSTPMSLN